MEQNIKVSDNSPKLKHNKWITYNVQSLFTQKTRENLFLFCLCNQFFDIVLPAIIRREPYFVDLLLLLYFSFFGADVTVSLSIPTTAPAPQNTTILTAEEIRKELIINPQETNGN